MRNAAGGFCKHCGRWIDPSERCSCAVVNGHHWGGGPGDEAGAVQEYAIRCLEDALSALDDENWDRAA